jgi:hypothetical protein
MLSGSARAIVENSRDLRPLICPHTDPGAAPRVRGCCVDTAHPDPGDRARGHTSHSQLGSVRRQWRNSGRTGGTGVWWCAPIRARNIAGAPSARKATQVLVPEKINT